MYVLMGHVYMCIHAQSRKQPSSQLCQVACLREMQLCALHCASRSRGWTQTQMEGRSVPVLSTEAGGDCRETGKGPRTHPGEGNGGVGPAVDMRSD